MLRRLLILFVLFLPFPALSECRGENLFDALPVTEREQLTAAVRADPYGRGLLWQATKGTSTIFVLGTYHLPDPRHDAIVARVRPLLAQSDMLIVEATGEDEAEMANLLVTQPGLILIQEPPSLIGRLTDAEWQLVARELKARGIPPFLGATMKPWFLGITLAAPACAMPEFAAGAKGLDRRLEAVAAERGMAIRALDDIEALIDLLAGDPLEVQMEDLRIGLRLLDLGPDMIATTQALYFAEEPLLLWEISRHVLQERGGDDAARLAEVYDEMEAKLLVGRNRDWIGQILDHADARTVFLAVGAAHLGMESGILPLLAKAGYEVTPLPLSLP